MTLLGHSYGAIVALEAALLVDDLQTLVLYEPPLPVSDQDPGSEPVLAEMESLVDAGEREQALGCSCATSSTSHRRRSRRFDRRRTGRHA